MTNMRANQNTRLNKNLALVAQFGGYGSLEVRTIVVCMV